MKLIQLQLRLFIIALRNFVMIMLRELTATKLLASQMMIASKDSVIDLANAQMIQ